MIRIVALLVGLLASSAAHAHPGDHSHLDFATLGRHLLEPDHLVSIVGIVLLMGLAFGLGRRLNSWQRRKL